LVSAVALQGMSWEKNRGRMQQGIPASALSGRRSDGAMTRIIGGSFEMDVIEHVPCYAQNR
jgi:hypothetical protein